MITQTTLSDRIISQKIGTSAELNDAYKTIDNLKEDIVELNTTINDLEQDIADLGIEHEAEINELNKEHQAEIESITNGYESEIESINQGYIDRDNELMVIINDINTLL